MEQKKAQKGAFLGKSTEMCKIWEKIQNHKNAKFTPQKTGKNGTNSTTIEWNYAESVSSIKLQKWSKIQGGGNVENVLKKQKKIWKESNIKCEKCGKKCEKSGKTAHFWKIWKKWVKKKGEMRTAFPPEKCPKISPWKKMPKTSVQIIKSGKMLTNLPFKNLSQMPSLFVFFCFLFCFFFLKRKFCPFPFISKLQVMQIVFLGRSMIDNNTLRWHQLVLGQHQNLALQIRRSSLVPPFPCQQKKYKNNGEKTTSEWREGQPHFLLTVKLWV